MKFILFTLTGVGIAICIIFGVVMLPSLDHTDDKSLRIAYFPNIGHIVPIVGVEHGFFEKRLNNVTIEPRVFDNGPQTIESLFARSIDLAYVGPGPAINGFLNSDGNIRILSGAASGGASFIIHPDSDIQNISDFAGKRIAAPQIGNTQDVSLRNTLKLYNLSTAERGGSVIIYNIPNPDIYTLFTKGDVDGAWVAEPWATILEIDLGGKRLFYEEELWANGTFASVLLVGDIRYVKENPLVVSDFIAAHNDAIVWIEQNPTNTRDTFNSFLDSYLGQSLSKDIVDTSLSNVKVTADPLYDSINEFAKQADSLGYLGRDGYNIDTIFYEVKDT